MKNKIIQSTEKFSFFEKMFLFSPIVVWFSYFPNFQIGRESGTNLELSIPLIFCFALSLAAIFEISKNFRQNFRQLSAKKAFWLSSAFVVWNGLSIFWSENTLRAILTSGVWGVLWLIFIGLLLSRNLVKMLPILTKIFIVSAVINSILAIIQVAIGAFTDFGLCRGCLATGFGFVRPSVFAIEPQFFGSMLLAPILIEFWLILSGNNDNKHKIALILMLIAIYLTLSRGAIFALVPAMILEVFIVNKELRLSLKKGFLKLVIFLFASFSVGMLWHGIFTELNPRIADGFYDSVSKSINQLSLGRVSLPKNRPVEKPVEKQSGPGVQDSKELINKLNAPKASFDGYVEKSTDERTSLNRFAVQTWSRNLHTILFGVGAGGAGKAILRTTHQTGWEFEIIQNEPLSILLELGIIGFAIWVSFIIFYTWSTRRYKLSWAILFAFLLQWNFFSGLPNALHIYLILALILALNYFDKFEIKL